MTRIAAKTALGNTAAAKTFLGFSAPTSNTTYTPNQFFDVCVPHYSRGVVRLVAFMIRQALGWCDAEGKPQQERVRLSYQELVNRAGIARSEIRKTLDAALEGGFIECVQAGRASQAYVSGQCAYYQLRWDSQPEYIKDPKSFRGFYERDGHRTDIPNQFFDRVVRNEPLSIVKVVASVIRFSIGFQAPRGGRRQQVRLSYTHIQRYAQMGDRKTLVEALRGAEDRHYIERIDRGYIDFNAGRESRPGMFALRWADTSPLRAGMKTPPANFDLNRYANPTGTGPIIPPEDQYEKPTDTETKLRNETSKQQQADVVKTEALGILKGEGFTDKVASELASKFPIQQIREQIAWLARRACSRNRLGMLRCAIEEHWSEPPEIVRSNASPGRQFASHFYAGLAGNNGDPVADPSTTDAKLAEGFVQRLLAIRPARGEVSELARQFAAYVRGRRRNSDFVSLRFALRSDGDAWLTHFQREEKQYRRKTIAAAQIEHRKKFEPVYLRFVADAESTCQLQRPGEYANFLSRYRSSPWIPGAIPPERIRLLSFQRTFELPDFWQWDAEVNPERFHS